MASQRRLFKTVTLDAEGHRSLVAPGKATISVRRPGQPASMGGRAQ
jgi:hypothetical protein